MVELLPIWICLLLRTHLKEIPITFYFRYVFELQRYANVYCDSYRCVSALLLLCYYLLDGLLWWSTHSKSQSLRDPCPRSPHTWRCPAHRFFLQSKDLPGLAWRLDSEPFCIDAPLERGGPWRTLERGGPSWESFLGEQALEIFFPRSFLSISCCVYKRCPCWRPEVPNLFPR